MIALACYCCSAGLVNGGGGAPNSPAEFIIVCAKDSPCSLACFVARLSRGRAKKRAENILLFICGALAPRGPHKTIMEQQWSARACHSLCPLRNLRAWVEEHLSCVCVGWLYRCDLRVTNWRARVFYYSATTTTTTTTRAKI